MWPTEHELGYITVSICDFLVLFSWMTGNSLVCYHLTKLLVSSFSTKALTAFTYLGVTQNYVTVG